MTQIKYLQGWLGGTGAAAALLISVPSSADDVPVQLVKRPLIDTYAQDDESEAGIKKIPSVRGDTETYRRNFLMRAWQASHDKNMPEKERYAEMFRWVKAADEIRSTTFTRCNLGILAQEMGEPLDAAEYFRAEFQTRYPHDESPDNKLRRDLCEMSGREVLANLAELTIVAPDKSDVFVGTHLAGRAPLAASVFVTPKEEHVVRVKLPKGEGELRETVSLRAGESRTLELYPPKKPEPNIVVKEVPVLVQMDPGWRRDVRTAGWVLGGVGLGLLAGGSVLRMVTDHQMDEIVPTDNAPCTQLNPNHVTCAPLHADIHVANVLTYLSLGFLTAGGIGLGIGYSGPASPVVGMKAQALQLKLPTYVSIQGAW